MTRAALLPAGSDPFLIAYWLRNYATWADRVDELHITVSGKLEPEALAYIEACVAAVPHASMYYMDHRTDHGAMLTFLVGKTEADHVMFCEDDAYIRRTEIIDECFKVAEAGGIAATPRGSYASEEVTAAAGAAFGEQYAYWPCFVFVAREALLATDMRLGAMHWAPGDIILGRMLRSQSVADTFVWGSYQLRAQGLKEDLRDNCRVTEDPMSVPHDAPWFHVGSLSSGHGWTFMTDDPVAHASYPAEVETFKRIPVDDATRRLSWWQRVWECAKGDIPEYHERYGAGLSKFRDDVGLDWGQVNAYIRRYQPLVTWSER